MADTNTFVLLGIGAVVAIIAISVIFGVTTSATSISTMTNGSFAGVYNTYVSLGYTDLVSITGLRNSTGNNKTSGTDFIADLSGGRINVSNANDLNGTYYIDYTFRPAGYIHDSMARTVVNYAPMMLALVLFVFIAGFAFMKSKL